MPNQHELPEPKKPQSTTLRDILWGIAGLLCWLNVLILLSQQARS